MESVIRLFKAVPIKTKGTKATPHMVLYNTVKRGFIFSPEVVFNYSEKELMEIITRVEREVGLSAEKMNNSFHKSWGKVKNASIFQLVAEQLIHYFTTYGFERLGIYDEDTVYIPNERLDIPELETGITLTIIKGYTKQELKNKLLSMLNLGIALKEDTRKDVVDVALFVNVNEEDIEAIRNKETKTVLYEYLGKVPINPIEFLRFMVYKTTDKTLLIKNKVTIEAIKEKENISVLRYFKQYERDFGLEKLAQIFFRFKPLFLAFRTNSQMKTIINRIRRLADTHHIPMKSDYLNEVTARIGKREISGKRLIEELDRVNTFRKIRLAYALNFRTQDVDSILYRIRNGKSYAKEFSFIYKKEATAILSIVLDSIISDLRENVEGKTIYIPNNIFYALPATEKQFTGDFPSGSYVVVPKDMITGVHWTNVNRHRIDLDLSVVSVNVGKIGWDSRYRSSSRSIMFSGDLTDAPLPKGATELYYTSKDSSDTMIMMLNYYNFDEDIPVPYKILIGTKDKNTFGGHYTINPNNVICVAKSKLDKKQQILGLIDVVNGECRFYFMEANIGKSITSKDNDYTEQSRKFLYNYYTTAISLNEILELAGAIMVTNKDNVDVDLSPENLEKDKILKLLV